MKELEQILQNNFQLSTSESLPDSESEYLKRLQKLLAVRIEHFINTDLEKLLQILYRIDVAQSESDAAFELGEIKKISMDLAEKIIRRQLRKIDYAREFYGKD